MRQSWGDFGSAIRTKLIDADDVRLWHAAIDELFRDAEFLCQHATTKSPIFANVGLCSHWLSPHNGGSWLADARYAWPSGYGGGGQSIRGLPDFDWSLIWRWDKPNKQWTLADQVRGKRPLTFRVAVPARTARRIRAVVHAFWTPGSPTIPSTKLVQAYGFHKNDAQWVCTSAYFSGPAYEVERIAT